MDFQPTLTVVDLQWVNGLEKIFVHPWQYSSYVKHTTYTSYGGIRAQNLKEIRNTYIYHNIYHIKSYAC
jgi:hypothetical protein